MSRTVLALSLLLLACREEPTIVIKFEPNDLSTTKPVDLAPRATPDLAVAAAKKKHECKLAADCAVEPVDCCDCAHGGKQHAIARKALAASKAERKKKCAETMCSMMVSSDVSCAEHAACVEGACVLQK